MSLASRIKGKGPSGFGYGSTADEVTDGIDLNGKAFLLTGSNSGLGLETLRVLSLRGAHVFAAARSVDKAGQAIDAVSAKGTPLACDLSDPASVRACVESVRKLGTPLSGIICNAGIMALPKLEIKYGLELQFLTNHIGHFIWVQIPICGFKDIMPIVGTLVSHHMALPSAVAQRVGVPWVRDTFRSRPTAC